MDVFGPAPLDPPLFGLLSVANVVRDSADSNSDWVGGFEFESRSGRYDSRLVSVCGTETDVVLHAGDTTVATHEIRPFGIQVDDACLTSFGFKERTIENLLEVLELETNRAVEKELADGPITRSDGTGNRFFSAGTNDTPTEPQYAVDVTPSATAVKIRYGVALLEGALRRSGFGGPGIIHAPATAGSVIPAKVVEGPTTAENKLQTVMGNWLVVGSGYTGRGPGNSDVATAPNDVWLYATGPVTVRLGEPFVLGDNPGQFVNRQNNTYQPRAERSAAVNYDGNRLYCVHVDLSLDYA